MPIKDLSDAIRLPRLGKIHLGKKHPEKGYPMKTDYFVFDKDHSLTEQAHKIFGNEPKTLRIYIPSEDEEVWCSQYYQSYDQTHGLVCRGDGEKALMMVDTKTGEMANPKSAQVALRECACQGKTCPNYIAKKCHERMSLRFLIPELPGLGVWQIDTGSINSILNINSSASLIRSAFKRISLIPLELTLEPAQVNNPESGKKQTVYVLNLRTSVTIVQLAERAREDTQKRLVAPLEDYDPADLWDGPATEAPKSATTPDEDFAKLGHDKPPVESTSTAQAPETPPAEAPKAKEVVKGAYAEMPKATKERRDPATIKSLAHFMKFCFEDFGLQPKQVLAELNINSQSEISNIAEAFQKIASVR